MKEQFLNYNLSKRINNLGFKTMHVFKYYFPDPNLNLGDKFILVDRDMRITGGTVHSLYKKGLFENTIPAPLYQQVFDWFREEHSLMIITDLTSHGKYFFNIENVKTFEEIYYDPIECYDTFSEMSEKAVEKLIEIVENKNE